MSVALLALSHCVLMLCVCSVGYSVKKKLQDMDTYKVCECQTSHCMSADIHSHRTNSYVHSTYVVCTTQSDSQQFS